MQKEVCSCAITKKAGLSSIVLTWATIFYSSIEEHEEE